MSFTISDAQGNAVHLHVRRWFGSLILPKSQKRVCSLNKDCSGKLFDKYNTMYIIRFSFVLH